MHSTVVSAGGVANTGGVWSSIVIVCVTVAELPQASVTVHVLITVAGQLPEGEESEPVTEPEVSQLSVYGNAIIGGTSLIHSTVVSAGGVANTGGVWSSIVMVCVTVAELPQASVTVHVLITVAGQLPEGEESVPITVPEVSQLSVYGNAIIGGTSLIHSTVVSAGGVANTGGVWSSIVIVCVTVAELPQASVTVHVRVIVAGQLPEGAESVPITEPEVSQLSVYGNAIIAGISSIHSTVVSAGGVANTGGVWSSIVIVCVTVAELPQASVTVHVRVIVAGQLPEGEESVPITEPDVSQLSVYGNAIIAGISSMHSTVVSAGGVANTGGVWSSIVMVCVTVAELPQASVTVHVLITVAGQLPEGEESVPITEPDVSQLSVYGNAIIAGISSMHSTVVSAGGVANTGGVTSTVLVMICVHVFVLPHASVAI
jgi:hypothetical protein